MSAGWLLGGGLIVVCVAGALVSLCKAKHAKGSGESIYGDTESAGGDRSAQSMGDRIYAWIASF